MRIAVTSPSFSKHPELIREMENSFSDFKLNVEGTRFSKDELIEYLGGYDAVIVGLDTIDKEVIDALPEIKIIAKYGVGLNNIDLDYCEKKNISIGWTGGVNKLSVAEMVVGNMLSLCRNLTVSSNNLKNGQWIKDGGFQLTGKTIGIIGVGHIGKEVIRLLKPFNCKLLVNDVISQDEYYASVGAVEIAKESLFKQADIITIHTPLVSETDNMINEASIQMMKDGAIIINSARGGIVNQKDLITGFNSGKIGGAALDVYHEEPVTDMDLLSIPNLINTPHIGGNSKEAVYLMGMSAINALIAFEN
jgi:D-3-phosphoglycerate dehydrogenase